MNKETFSFVIYMIHACADYWKKNPSEVYKKMKSINCIMGFLVPNYDQIAFISQRAINQLLCYESFYEVMKI